MDKQEEIANLISEINDAEGVMKQLFNELRMKVVHIVAELELSKEKEGVE